MKSGDVVKVAFIQKDKKVKKRPAVLLKQTEPHGDWIVCGISGKLHWEVKGIDIVIDEKHPDFGSYGLDYPGLIRTAFVITIPQNIIEGAIGNISQTTFNGLISNLKKYVSK